jgi:cell division protein FtsQ
MPVTEAWHPSMGRPAPPAPAGRVAPRAPASRASWVAAAVALALLLFVALWVTHSAVFRMRRVSVSGNRHLTESQVLRIAGIDGRTNVLWLSTSAVERRLESNPWIRVAHVSRTLPTAVSVSISERTAVASARVGGRLYLLSADGMVLGTATSQGRLPVIELSRASVRPGARLSSATGGLDALMALPPSLRRRVGMVETDGAGDLVVTLRTGVRAIYGDASAARAKGEALASVLRWAADHGVHLAYVDVRAPVTPAAGPVEPATPTPAATLTPPVPPGRLPPRRTLGGPKLAKIGIDPSLPVL